MKPTITITENTIPKRAMDILVRRVAERSNTTHLVPAAIDNGVVFKAVRTPYARFWNTPDNRPSYFMSAVVVGAVNLKYVPGEVTHPPKHVLDLGYGIFTFTRLYSAYRFMMDEVAPYDINSGSIIMTIPGGKEMELPPVGVIMNSKEGATVKNVCNVIRKRLSVYHKLSLLYQNSIGWPTNTAMYPWVTTLGEVNANDVASSMFRF